VSERVLQCVVWKFEDDPFVRMLKELVGRFYFFHFFWYSYSGIFFFFFWGLSVNWDFEIFLFKVSFTITEIYSVLIWFWCFFPFFFGIIFSVLMLIKCKTGLGKAKFPLN